VKNIYLILTCLAITGCTREQPPASKPEPAKARESRPAASAPAASAKVADDRPMIVAFGDSLSAGFGADPGQSYPDFVQKELDQRGYRYHVALAATPPPTGSSASAR
jgi:acyl-CoA thioesterase-1